MNSMKSRLPATPLDALNLSGVLKFIVKTIHTCADVFGFWKYPSSKASADFETMSLMDKIYWGYKSKKPIVFPEKGSHPGLFSKNKSQEIPLPAGFEKTDSVTFSAVGDLIKVDGLENSQDFLYEKVADLIFDNDIACANLESQLTGRDIGSYTFSDKETPPLCCTIEQYNALKSYKGKRFSFMHTACNHTFDMGLEGLETTLAQLEKDNITDLGTNRNPDDQRKGKIVVKNGIKFGFVSATFGLNGKEVPVGKEYMVNVVKFHSNDPKGSAGAFPLLIDQIGFCKEQGCDVIIASLHWGYEYEFFPRIHQVEIAHNLVEAGVDAIISHHAHVIQPVELYQTKRDPLRTAVIAYSLGNLTSSFSSPHLVLSGILNLSFVKGKMNGEGKTFIRDVTFNPVVQRDFIENGKPVIQIEKLDALLNDEYTRAIKRYADLIWGE